jgi:hypothetical protein
MKAMRERRRRKGLREIRLTLPDTRLPSVRRRIAAQVARLNEDDERKVMDWIESVSEFDNDPSR